ncbi:MAG: hypothetical protein PHX70_10080 [Clostridium sp.]|nr:hypothetical protein [Clostridium sp.]
MQKEPDDLERILRASAYDFEISRDYNDRLIKKISENKKVSSHKFPFVIDRTAAASLIASGILMLFLNMPIITNNFFSAKANVVCNYEYNLNVLKSQIGEWF